MASNEGGHVMTTGIRAASAVALALGMATATVLAAPPVSGLTPVGQYDTGLGANGAEILSVRKLGHVGALTNIAGSVDVLDLDDLTAPALARRVPIDPAFGTPNSVALHPFLDYFLVLSGSAGNTGTVSAFRISDGTFLASASVGIQPDSIAIAPNGEHAVVANEAEGVDEGDDGGAGSLSIVDLAGFDPAAPSTLTVVPVAIPALTGIAGVSTGRTDDIARLPIDNTPATIEPESVAYTRNSRFAYVTLQENNAVVRLDVQRRELEVFGVGQTTHLADLSTSGGYQPTSTLTAFREPDGIALPTNGKIFVTADEGDTRDGSGSGSPRGGRTVSVFDASTGKLLGDTGSQIDDAAAAAGLYPDSRSNRGGSEPEVLDLTKWRGRTLVAVGLERANAVALIDVSQEKSPTVVAIAPTGQNPEGVKFVRRGGDLFVLTANEASGTVSVLRVER
jgi:DNA-binding beta-propeller fold protein YncE